ncbi:MAG: hypothetical protein GY868_11960 [Deltaproteobacteria bacterium]|nr:hypothetical protein [Deltaproteobacteria bacterium]
MKENKKIEAAVAAVLQYIKVEEEECLQGAAGRKEIWKLSGRQSQMQLRTQVQGRDVNGWKLR